MAEKKPRKNKTKEEIEYEVKRNYEEKRQRAFVKDVLYPYLVANSKSIDDAKNMLYAASTGVQQTFHLAVGKEQTRLSEIKLSELNPQANILAGEEYNRDRELLNLFNGESVAIADSLLKGCKMAIESFEREASVKTPLKNLPAELLD